MQRQTAAWRSKKRGWSFPILWRMTRTYASQCSRIPGRMTRTATSRSISKNKESCRTTTTPYFIFLANFLRNGKWGKKKERKGKCGQLRKESRFKFSYEFRSRDRKFCVVCQKIDIQGAMSPSLPLPLNMLSLGIFHFLVRTHGQCHPPLC